MSVPNPNLTEIPSRPDNDRARNRQRAGDPLTHWITQIQALSDTIPSVIRGTWVSTTKSDIFDLREDVRGYF